MSTVCFSANASDPAHGYGHALFDTRIGVCALAWQPKAVLALQLPEVTAQATQERLLRELTQRLRGMGVPPVTSWMQGGAAVQLPDVAWQAVAGVQQLMAGWRAVEPPAAWVMPQPDPTAGAVLGDLRADVRHPCSNAPPCLEDGGALPQLLDIALDWRGVPDFARRVYALTRAIPAGQTRTYGELANELGGWGLARAVGQALGANPFAPVVPCHRVLAAGREPGGFSGGQGALTKLRMLELEGAAWGGTRSLFE